MNKTLYLLLGILIMAAVTYLIRVMPMILIRKKIQNRFIKSFLYYVPYAVLTAMAFPSILYATDSMTTAVAGTAVAVVLAFLRRSLLEVAAGACVAVWIVSLLC